MLGFNTGIELAQLGLLFLVVPWLLILARTRVYAAFRVAGAGVTAVLALGWLLERTLGLPNPSARPLAWLEAHSLHLLVALAGAMCARLVDRRRKIDAGVKAAGRAQRALRDADWPAAMQSKV